MHSNSWNPPLNCLCLLSAGIVNAIGVTIFIAPVQLYDSGTSNTSILLSQVTASYLSLSFFLILLNIPLLLYGLQKQGIVFSVYAIIAITPVADLFHGSKDHAAWYSAWQKIQWPYERLRKPLHFLGFLSSLALRIIFCLPRFWQLIQAFKGIAHSFPFA